MHSDALIYATEVKQRLSTAVSPTMPGPGNVSLSHSQHWSQGPVTSWLGVKKQGVGAVALCDVNSIGGII
jgi:hypothetical protein